MQTSSHHEAFNVREVIGMCVAVLVRMIRLDATAVAAISHHARRTACHCGEHVQEAVHALRQSPRHRLDGQSFEYSGEKLTARGAMSGPRELNPGTQLGNRNRSDD